MEKSFLTARERKVFDLLIKGKTTKEVANILLISEATVRSHVSNVLKKLNVKERAQAVYELIRLGEFSLQ
ncbi:helix-turn-helix domain-containing protein [Neobacillus cucumis]|uniref:helix-turn-helix domain-containing protein n=1 Tax=Neobacillus cucumis TaxID=1740721 RepID=UPI001FDAE63F|nr:LuxR family transcriptional regulator of spore coat protein [Neobacillus cucumis]